jgi:two-component system OmpR family response regulator
MDPFSRILIVDDDRDIRTLLADYLETNGYRAWCAADGVAMWKMLGEARPDLVVLDLNLPGDDGLTLCRKLRAESTIPVIMLTARNEPLDRILGLEMGADDYLAKPFEPRELLARIRSVLRRSHAMPSNVQADKVQKMHFAGWTLDLAARHLLNPKRSWPTMKAALWK